MGTKIKAYGDPAVAARLREARAAAGFATGRSAALAHRWAPSSVNSHERAERALTSADLSRYAQAYRADPRWIEAGVGGPSGEARPARGAPSGDSRPPPGEPAAWYEQDDPDRQARIEQRTRNGFMAFRLGVARRLAAFETASAACAHFGFHRATYGGHEYGRKGPLPEPAAKVYAAAFGVPADWLLLRRDPEGMPGPVAAAVEAAEAEASLTRIGFERDDDFVLRSVGSHPAFVACEAFADPARRGDVKSVESLLFSTASARRVTRSRRLGDPPVNLPEVLLSEILRVGMSVARAEAASYWTAPGTFLPGVTDGSAVVAVVTQDEPAIGLAAGDRVVIDPGPGAGQILVWSDGRLAVASVSRRGLDGIAPGGTILGRILATIRYGIGGPRTG